MSVREEKDEELEFMYRKLKHEKGKLGKPLLAISFALFLTLFFVGGALFIFYDNMWFGMLACAGQIVALLVFAKILPPTKPISFEGWNET